MSTDLYGIRVLDTKPEEHKLIIKVFVVYYDVTFKTHQPLPKDPSFFFRILWDKGDARFGKGGSIGVEVSVDQIGDETWVDNNTFRFIKNVELLVTANFPIKDYSSYTDFYYEKNGSWVDEDKLVQATYEIEVTDSKYFNHLSSEMSWGTTAYETQSLKVSHNHLNTLPDISNPVIRLNPFKDKSQEDGTISDVLFSEDQDYFFVLSESGEMVSYRTDNWEEIWRKETKIFFGKIEYDNPKKLIWVQHSHKMTDSVFNFEGAVVKEKMWPAANEELGKAFRSPLGNYFLLPHSSGDEISLYDAKGIFLWGYKSSNRGELFTAFFNNEKRLLVLETQSNKFKTFDLKLGTELSVFEADIVGYEMSIDPTCRFFSFRDSTATKIVEFEDMKTIFEYGTKSRNDDYYGQCIWSPNNQLIAIITTNKHTKGKEYYVTIYPIGIKGLQQ